MKKKIIFITLIVVVGFLGLVMQRWYSYVTNTQTPYDEIGIALQEYMPNPVKVWGCNKLKQTFSNQLPPHGCSVNGKWL